MAKKEELEKQILELTREYYKEVHQPQPAFEVGKTRVNYGGRCLSPEMKMVVMLYDEGTRAIPYLRR